MSRREDDRMRKEKGHALPIALAALAVGTLLVMPFLHITGTGNAASRIYTATASERYASEAGVEDAIWKLTKGTLAEQMPGSGDSTSYAMDQMINGMTVEVSVTRDQVSIASEDFESGGWSGGTGWLQGWQHEGNAAVVSDGYPHDGSYHLRLRGDSGLAKRPVDLSSAYDVRLHFWAKAKSFASGEEAHCLISPNGSDWTTVETWANGDDDNVYRFYDIDLSPYDLTGQFWIAFQSEMPGADSYFYVDSIVVLHRFPNSTLGTPSDNFESKGWTGGTGWLSDWEHSGRAYVTWLGFPKQGNYHMALLGPSGYAARQADLSNRQNAKLQCWVWPIAFEESDHADCLISNDGVEWLSLISWTIDDNDWYYHFIEVDIPQEYLTEGFRIAFQANMSDWDDFFMVDDLHIVGGPIAYEIVSTAGSTTTRACVSIVNGEVTVHSWYTERQ